MALIEIKDVVALGAPKQNDRSRAENTQPRNANKNVSSSIDKTRSRDRVEISTEARRLQGSSDESKIAKKLLASLPNVRANVVYEALAKLKAGLYSSDKIVSEAADKLLESGDLDDLITS